MGKGVIQQASQRGPGTYSGPPLLSLVHGRLQAAALLPTVLLVLVGSPRADALHSEQAREPCARMNKGQRGKKGERGREREIGASCKRI